MLSTILKQDIGTAFIVPWTWTYRIGSITKKETTVKCDSLNAMLW